MHSFLISTGFTVLMKERLGRMYSYYRLIYAIFSLFSLVPVLYFQLHLEEKILFVWPWPWSAVKYFLYAAALLLFYGGFRVYDIQYMLGIKQIRTMRDKKEKDRVQFTTAGILGYVRHPWYSGTILLVWAYGVITDVSLVSKVVLTVYILVGTLLEEKKLIREYGEQYLAYREKVPMLIPWKKR